MAVTCDGDVGHTESFINSVRRTACRRRLIPTGWRMAEKSGVEEGKS